MKVAIIGCGFVGLATGVTLAHLGHRVRLVEIDEVRLSSIQKGEAPFYEPDLSSMLSKGLISKKISAGSSIGEAVQASDIIIVSVQTPPLKTGAPKLKHLKDAVGEIAKPLAKGKIVVVRSTVPPGTTDALVTPILERGSGLSAGKDFGVAMSPEFLQEGRAVRDSLNPDRIVVGADSKKTGRSVLRLFEKLEAPKISTDTVTAEMVKYVSNCFLATKISYSNEIANLCERFGTDVNDVMEAVGLDPRIGDQFLRAGLGFGGSCLPKDLAALIATAESVGYRPELLRAVQRVNDSQPLRAVSMLEEELGDLAGKRICVLGLAFKAGVDDIRDTKAFPIAVELLARGAKVVGYDPMASASFIKLLPEISYAASAREALYEADGCIIQTEDKEFSGLGKEDFELMSNRFVIDGRRALSPKKLSRWGVKLRAIGLGRSA
ncbi:MAG TPA: UDP-glucose/GDP-mannose dehydrogenase family protein [Euryarchaeota archaeon]|nr:UDP-glucose/GDP-mannose dehydrogenase family protein [Euryarchaeota archaeon]